MQFEDSTYQRLMQLSWHKNLLLSAKRTQFLSALWICVEVKTWCEGQSLKRYFYRTNFEVIFFLCIPIIYSMLTFAIDYA